MRTFTDDARKTSPHGLDYREAGKRKRKFFKTERERKDFIKEQRLGDLNEGYSAMEWQRWLQLKRECELAGVTPEEAVFGYVRHHLFAAGAQNITVGDLCQQFIDSRIHQGRSKDYVRHLVSTLIKKLAASMGDRPAVAITPVDLKAWLSTAAGSDPVTYKNHLAYLKAAFAWAERRELISTNPARKLDPMGMEDKEPEFLTVEQAERLFSENKDDAELCALLAIQAFAGLRSANIERFEAGEIRAKERQLIMPAHKMKNRKRHMIEEHMALPNLWPWVERANLATILDPKSGYLNRYDYRRAMGFAAAKIPPMKNALRHSFTTYKCALDGEATKAAFTLAQRDPSVLWDHYKGLTTRAEAERYAQILP